MFLNQLGIVCSLGQNREEVANSLFYSDFIPMTKLHVMNSGRTVSEIVLPFSLSDSELEYANELPRCNQILKKTLDQIADDVSLIKYKYSASRIGVVLGTSVAGILEGEQAYLTKKSTGSWPKGFHYTQQEIACPSEFAASYLNVSGPSYTLSTACSSGGKALASASRLIESGICDAVIVGAVDTTPQLVLNGFDSLELLDQPICNPFSRNRRNITLGEGAAVFVMTKDQLTDYPIYLSGYGESSDAYHMNAPEPAGKGAELAIFDALKRANLSPFDILYINLHATGTILNDAMESACVNRIFGSELLCGSTKAMSGHTLGAAGAIEAGFIWLSLFHEKDGSIPLPQHRWDGLIDSLLSCVKLVNKRMNIYSEKKIYNMMSNSFAFGGSNVSVILSKKKA